MRRSCLVALALVAASCGAGGGGVPLDNFCASLVDAACGRAITCGTVANDLATCRTQAAEAMDECPVIVAAVGLGETSYDADKAGTFVSGTRATPCDGTPPDPIASGVFTPKRASGEACHSKASCATPLVCEGHTGTTPAGTCAAPS